MHCRSKIDKSFTTVQFMFSGYHKPYCLDISERERTHVSLYQVSFAILTLKKL